jgi:hypothetical protein
MTRRAFLGVIRAYFKIAFDSIKTLLYPFAGAAFSAPA